MQSKAELRKSALCRRKTIPSAVKAFKDNLIRNEISLSPLFLTAGIVSLYMPLLSEADIVTLMDGYSKVFVFPKIDGDKIIFCPVSSKEDFQKGQLGFLQPISDVSVEIGDIDLMMVPGLLFDRSGYRIGYGGGYYDRVLSGCPGIISMGVCFDEFLVDIIPADTWDAKVRYIVTESGIIKTDREE